MGSFYNLVKVCMGLSQTSKSLYGVMITVYEVITTPLTILWAKILHDYRWGCDNSMGSFNNLVIICMGLSQASESLNGVMITVYEVIKTPFIVRFTSNGFWVWSRLL
jgi:hypothetical protein